MNTAAISAGLLGGATTIVARSAARRFLQARAGSRLLPGITTPQRGLAAMLLWSAAAGVLLAAADLVNEQRRRARSVDDRRRLDAPEPAVPDGPDRPGTAHVGRSR